MALQALTRGAVCASLAALSLVWLPLRVTADEGAVQRAFSSPGAAGEALVAALKADDPAALSQVLGSSVVSLLTSGDPIADQQEYRRFVSAYDLDHHWSALEEGTAMLAVGKDGWPFPIPLVDGEGGWHFDGARGADEIVNRRIGSNELGAIQACLAFVDAEREYYRRNPRGREMPEYARFIPSGEGEKDGLYWESAAGETPSPLGRAYAVARSQGYAYDQGESKPFHGYLYRVLHAQGPAAPGGAYDYVQGDEMTRGFALVAWPAKYDASGVTTFIVNQLGLVYEKDLGPETGKIAKSLPTFDPDDSWAVVPSNARALPGS